LRSMLRRLNVLIACGDDVRANVLEYMPNIERAGCRIVTIRNGIDTSRLANGLTDKPLRDRLGIGDDVRLLGFLGRFMEQKGFLPLLDVLQRLRTKGATASFRLLAVGSGDFEREYRAEVARRGL